MMFDECKPRLAASGCIPHPVTHHTSLVPRWAGGEIGVKRFALTRIRQVLRFLGWDFFPFSPRL